jgi:hypothetical protein
VDQADEYNQILRKELKEKLRKERVFIIQKLDKESGLVLKTVYPNIEVYQQEMEHMNSSEHESSQNQILHNNEKVSIIGDIPL